MLLIRVLYIDKLNASGNRGGLKCILSDSLWYTPSEFEGLSGKGRSKNWRKSVYHASTIVPMDTFLASIGVNNSKSGSASPRLLSPARTADLSFSLVIDPILAFIKAY